METPSSSSSSSSSARDDKTPAFDKKDIVERFGLTEKCVPGYGYEHASADYAMRDWLTDAIASWRSGESVVDADPVRMAVHQTLRSMAYDLEARQEGDEYDADDVEDCACGGPLVTSADFVTIGGMPGGRVLATRRKVAVVDPLIQTLGPLDWTLWTNRTSRFYWNFRFCGSEECFLLAVCTNYVVVTTLVNRVQLVHHAEQESRARRDLLYELSHVLPPLSRIVNEYCDSRVAAAVRVLDAIPYIADHDPNIVPVDVVAAPAVAVTVVAPTPKRGRAEDVDENDAKRRKVQPPSDST